jgi:stage III sporulation protein AF
MISIINSWAKGIILAIIIATIIEIILPEGNNKKYIKTIIGIYILFVMIHPFVSTNKININSIIQDSTSEIDEYETEDLTLETNQYIEETYTSKIQEDMREKVKNKGYNINSLNLNIETKNEELYGQVNSINIKISKMKDIDKKQNVIESTIQKIDNVEIDLSNKPIMEESVNEEITENEIEGLKEYLSNEYGTAKEKIHINE